MSETDMIKVKKEEIREDYQMFQMFQDMLEIPANVILYRVLKIVGFDQMITDEEVAQYCKALSSAYKQFRNQLPSQLAFNYPSRQNYDTELFKEVRLEDGTSGFMLRSVNGKTEKELLEYRLALLEVFKDQQCPAFLKVVALADQRYRRVRIAQIQAAKQQKELVREKTWKEKVLSFPSTLRAKFVK